MSAKKITANWYLDPLFMLGLFIPFLLLHQINKTLAPPTNQDKKSGKKNNILEKLFHQFLQLILVPSQIKLPCAKIPDRSFND